MRLENTSGEQGELEGFSVLDDGVAGVSAAVEADDKVVLIGEEIDDLPFGLVAPLQADDTSAGHGLPTPEDRRPEDHRPGSGYWDSTEKRPATPEAPGG